MVLINLKDYYPELHTEDYFLYVSDKVYKTLCDFNRTIENQKRNKRRRPKNSPLDDCSNLEARLRFPPIPLLDRVEKNLDFESLHEVISKLSDKQYSRIYAHYFLGLSKTEIAKIENVNKAQITKSIQRALEFIRKNYKTK